MDYYAGLDVSMEETHICVVDRDGVVVHETRVASTPADHRRGADGERRRVGASCSRLAGWPRCFIRVIQREARDLRREPAGLSGAEVCDPQDRRNDARGLAHLARTGFFKPVHAKSLPPTPSRADYRPQEARRSARHAGQPDLWFGGGVRRPAPPLSAQRSSNKRFG